MLMIILLIFLRMMQEIPEFIFISGIIGAIFFIVWSMEKTKKYLDSINPSLPEEVEGIILGCIFVSPIHIFLDPDIRRHLWYL